MESTEQLMLFAADSLDHVRISALPERAQGSQASAADCGESTPVWLASFYRDTSSWRTCQHSVLGGLELFSETWPRSGIQVAGTVSLPLPSGHRIVEIASGS